MHIDTDILTHTPWRAVCSDCDWTSDNSDRLSVVMRQFRTHKLEAHAPVFRGYPAPPKLSEVVALSRKAIGLD